MAVMLAKKPVWENNLPNGSLEALYWTILDSHTITISHTYILRAEF